MPPLRAYLQALGMLAAAQVAVLIWEYILGG